MLLEKKVLSVDCEIFMLAVCQPFPTFGFLSFPVRDKISGCVNEGSEKLAVTTSDPKRIFLHPVIRKENVN